jgi:transglutaminase-like putative cysteine protease
MKQLCPPILIAGLLLFFSWGGQASAQTLSCTPPAADPEIAALARALNYDLNTIYEYVYYNVEYSPTAGSKKGALGTYIDGRGNNVDQNVLFVSLLTPSS